MLNIIAAHGPWPSEEEIEVVIRLENASAAEVVRMHDSAQSGPRGRRAGRRTGLRKSHPIERTNSVLDQRLDMNESVAAIAR